ncbi:hypothetical protein TTHERM_000138209 (macronuclear) [Tetrahymena thermophila SB210]|uniref:Uncharacterized protein n=1 Tax=Tetrahymena thermophila (strain SB210) TaxID=312017 RepID=W7XGV3_TETTS|nr:hypothetical protein TTHERM_000138209 [Tetrahymena thermophila SB210]EWS73476.1 hypothetical protein TTHERM_000138209 [Tetrahymena thermophila SB210]|eukprot:XP_012653958.1 hypothetical protein TTHERM_000138209 [Tetrahymena thermophila SB210]
MNSKMMKFIQQMILFRTLRIFNAYKFHYGKIVNQAGNYFRSFYKIQHNYLHQKVLSWIQKITKTQQIVFNFHSKLQTQNKYKIQIFLQLIYQQQTISCVFSNLRQFQQINNLTIRIMQKEAAVLTEDLYQIISENMKNLEYLNLTFDNCYIHLPNQDFYFQQINNLKHLSIDIKGYSRSTFRHLGLLINCVSQLKNLEDLDLFIVSSDYNLLSQDLTGIKNIIYLKIYLASQRHIQCIVSLGYRNIQQYLSLN